MNDRCIMHSNRANISAPISNRSRVLSNYELSTSDITRSKLWTPYEHQQCQLKCVPEESVWVITQVGYFELHTDICSVCRIVSPEYALSYLPSVVSSF